MTEPQAPYHHANSLTVLNGEQEPRVLNGRMANIVRKLLDAEADIADISRNVKITMNCKGSQADIAVQKFY